MLLYYACYNITYCRGQIVTENTAFAWIFTNAQYYNVRTYSMLRIMLCRRPYMAGIRVYLAPLIIALLCTRVLIESH